MVGGSRMEALQIIQDGKFLSRLLSKETSAAYTSNRVYYGVAACAVPFIWESQPGTPKNTTASAAAIPPLTPPPSYFISAKKNASTNYTPRTLKQKLIHSLLPKLVLRKPRPPPSPSSASWSSSSGSHRRGCGSSPLSSSFSSISRGEDEEREEERPREATPKLSFWERRGASDEVPGCYPAEMMKKVLMSIVGHGTAA
ncbi:alkylated DNA repair protein [Apostasia shenzhenica]|uniref:Alkylated DNA repair protein n=1 Tax=Apostasia shenzhenica TaxID=1088818 RepID=A0A2I0BHI5_9ASPA|nr:alkylated DNA repair protein [Apostasia shenzhenica]